MRAFSPVLQRKYKQVYFINQIKLKVLHLKMQILLEKNLAIQSLPIQLIEAVHQPQIHFHFPLHQITGTMTGNLLINLLGFLPVFFHCPGYNKKQSFLGDENMAKQQRCNVAITKCTASLSIYWKSKTTTTKRLKGITSNLKKRKPFARSTTY